MTSIKLHGLPLRAAKKLLSQEGIKLQKHQRKAVKWMASKEHKSSSYPFGGILADEMGLGKTLEIIALILGKPTKSTLIIVPANLISQWVSEFKKFAPHLNIITDGQLPTNPDDIVISSYIKATRSKIFYEYKWGRVILDEAHYIRNSKGIIHKRLCKLKSKHKWCLTGTPIQNREQDFVALCRFIGFETIDNLIDVAQSHMFRRTKDDVAIQLPKITIENINLTTTEKQRYDNVCGCYDIHHLVRQLRTRQFAIMPPMAIKGIKNTYKEVDSCEMNTMSSNKKMDTIIKTVIECKDNEKPIIFCHFKDEMFYIESKLKANGLISGMIHGGVAMDTRKPLIENHAKYHTLIIQLQAGSTGLNLQMFDTIYFTAPHWNPTHEQQAIARIHRIGQTKPVTIKKFTYEKSIETHMNKIQQEKLDMAENIYIHSAGK